MTEKRKQTEERDQIEKWTGGENEFIILEEKKEKDE